MKVDISIYPKFTGYLFLSSSLDYSVQIDPIAASSLLKMLSTKGHFRCWVLSILAASTYQGLLSTTDFGQLVSKVFLLPLLVYFVYMIFAGPRTDCQGWPHTLSQLAATGCLSTCLGAIADDYTSNGERNYFGEYTRFIVHTTLAFSAINTLEVIRQDVSSKNIY